MYTSPAKYTLYITQGSASLTNTFHSIVITHTHLIVW